MTDHVGGWVAVWIGATSFVVALALLGERGDAFWCTIPCAGIVALATALSFARRERAFAQCALGLGLAAAALVVGWVVALVLVLGATLALIAILHHVL